MDEDGNSIQIILMILSSETIFYQHRTNYLKFRQKNSNIFFEIRTIEKIGLFWKIPGTEGKDEKLQMMIFSGRNISVSTPINYFFQFSINSKLK